MFERKVHIEQHELTQGVIVRHGRSWVRIHHIEPRQAGSVQRKGTCTLRHQTTPGAFTVWFLPGRHKVIADSLPVDFAIKPQAMPTVEPESEPQPEVHEHVQRGVRNTITGPINGTAIQAGVIDGQVASDFFKNERGY